MGPKLGWLGPMDCLLVYLVQSSWKTFKFSTPAQSMWFTWLWGWPSFYSLLFADYCIGNVLGPT